MNKWFFTRSQRGQLINAREGEHSKSLDVGNSCRLYCFFFSLVFPSSLYSENKFILGPATECHDVNPMGLRPIFHIRLFTHQKSCEFATIVWSCAERGCNLGTNDERPDLWISFGRFLYGILIFQLLDYWGVSAPGSQFADVHLHSSSLCPPASKKMRYVCPEALIKKLCTRGSRRWP